MYPRSSLFTLNVPININTAVFDASPAFPPEPRHTFIYKTEQLGRTECVCVCVVSGECVCRLVYFSENVLMCLCIVRRNNEPDLTKTVHHRLV